MPRKESKFVHVERGISAEKLQPWNINVSFNGCDRVYIYSNEMVVDVETGIVKNRFSKIIILITNIINACDHGLECALTV
jgi:hypothetical protein